MTVHQCHAVEGGQNGEAEYLERGDSLDLTWLHGKLLLDWEMKAHRCYATDFDNGLLPRQLQFHQRYRLHLRRR